MNTEKWEKIERLCYETANLHETDRKAYLEMVCAGDPELLKEVTSLLEHQHSEKFSQPLVHIEPSLVFGDNHPSSDRIIGPYRIIRTIAKGGMGHVYLAVRNDAQFERFVALKVIQKGLVSEDVLARFYEERQILASLNHPNIARLFDGGTTGENLPWFAMEYIEGRPITEYCIRHNATTEEKLTLFLSVCSAVQYAHQNLVIHRDLKPANIIITADGTPKLLDFGIAKLMTIEQTSGQKQYRNRMMTPEYSSPEQVRNEPISTVSDVYALGVLLYEIMAGVLPYHFKNRTPACIEQTVCTVIPELPSAVSRLKELKGDLDSIIMKALRKKPSDRYVSVEQMADDLRRYQKSLPVIAHQKSAGYQIKKFLYRHTWSAIASGIIALLIIVFGSVTLMQSRVVKARALEAEQERDRAKEVSNFLTELFGSADPSRAENKSLTAIELLQRGADRVETDLSDQPDLQSNLYLVISDVYESLGLYDKGLDLAQKAYALQKELYGNKSPEIARSLNSMGWFYRQKGEYAKADSLLTLALSMRWKLYSSPHMDIARSLNDLAVLKQTEGDYAATDTLLQQAIEIQKALVGEQHESVGVALSNYAALKWRLGDLPAAERLTRESLHIFEETVGEKDMRVAIAMTNLAAFLMEQYKLEEAEIYYRKALKIRLQLLGEEHPDIAYSYVHLGNLLREKGEYEEAEKLLVKALTLRTKLLGENHMLVGDSKRVLGLFYEQTGKYPQAENYYTGALKIFRHIFPEGHAQTALVLHLLGRLYLHTGNPQKAQQYLQEALAMRKRIFGENDTRTADSMIKLGICLADLGNRVQAKPLLTSGLQILNHSNKNVEPLKKEAMKALSSL